MSNNANIVIAQSLIMRIKIIAEKALSNEITIDNGITEIGYTVDAYNEYFYTGRDKVSR